MLAVAVSAQKTVTIKAMPGDLSDDEIEGLISNLISEGFTPLQATTSRLVKQALIDIQQHMRPGLPANACAIYRITDSHFP